MKTRHKRDSNGDHAISLAYTRVVPKVMSTYILQMKRRYTYKNKWWQ